MICDWIYGIFMSGITPGLAGRIDQNDRLVVNMTMKEAKFEMVMCGKSHSILCQLD